MNTDGMTFRSQTGTGWNRNNGKKMFQVNLNSDGTFKSFKTDVTEPAMVNIVKAWASMLQIKRADGGAYVNENEVSFRKSMKHK